VPANTAPGSAEIEPIRGALRAVRFEVKGEGLHTGELEAREDLRIGGIAVHIGARIAALAGPGETLRPDIAERGRKPPKDTPV